MKDEIYSGPTPQQWYGRPTFESFMRDIGVFADYCADEFSDRDGTSLWHVEPVGLTVMHTRSQRGIGGNSRISIGRPAVADADAESMQDIANLVTCILGAMNQPAPAKKK